MCNPGDSVNGGRGISSLCEVEVEYGIPPRLVAGVA